MDSKVLIIAFANLAIIHISNAQCMNRFIPGCGPNILPIAETLLPNQLLYPPNNIGPNIIDYPYEILPNIPGAMLPNVPCSRLPKIPGTIMPNLLPGSLLPNMLPGPLLPSLPSVLQTPTTTIIQDSTVANNLANVVQLLVVSNLLANKLPQNEVFIPSYPPVEYLPVVSGPCRFGDYNYVY